MKFILTADWRLEKAFRRFDPDARLPVTEAWSDAAHRISADALRTRVLLMTCRNRAFGYSPANRLSIVETAA